MYRFASAFGLDGSLPKPSFAHLGTELQQGVQIAILLCGDYGKRDGSGAANLVEILRACQTQPGQGGADLLLRRRGSELRPLGLELLDSRPGSPDLRIYRRLDFGTLLRLNMLDTRQYRTDQPGGLPTDFGPQALGAARATGTLTWPEQEAWLVDGLRSSPALWNVLGQQVMMAATRFVAPPPTSIVNLDQWDGYSPQRARLLSAVRASGATNPIVLAGDIHSTWVSDLRLNFDDPASPVVATEFVAMSVTSEFPAELVPVVEASNRAFNPWVRYFNGRTHGWLRMAVDRSRWLTEERSIAAVDSPDAPASTTARWIVEAGRPGAVPA